MNNIEFEAFIVPNHTIEYADAPKYLQRSIKTRSEVLGLDAPEDGEYIQVWIIGSKYGEDNLTDHGYPQELKTLLGLDDPEDTRFAPGLIARKHLEGLKEGDYLESVTRNGKKLRIKFEQKPYRYGRFGTIEEVLEYLK